LLMLNGWEPSILAHIDCNLSFHILFMFCFVFSEIESRIVVVAANFNLLNPTCAVVVITGNGNRGRLYGPRIRCM
jgi:hypothetical protein